MNSVQRILNQKFIDLKSKNPRLSHRFYAQKLGISSGALSEILKGKRKVSPKLATRLAARLHLDPKTTAEFIGHQHASDSEVDSQLDYLQLSDDQFHLISEWPHFAILNLVKSEDCQHRAEWFAERLNLPLRTVQDAVDRLLRLGMLTFQKRKFTRSKAHFKTSDEVLNLSIQKSHLEDLEMIREHLTHLEVHERDLTSITFLLDPAKMPDFKKWIRKAQDQFSHKFETTKSTTPYRLTMALYPLKRSKK
ncbi:MAG: TIGR02147 family protein [Pseudobdellovibrionaceae bacterium]